MEDTNDNKIFLVVHQFGQHEEIYFFSYREIVKDRNFSRSFPWWTQDQRSFCNLSIMGPILFGKICIKIFLMGPSFNPTVCSPCWKRRTYLFVSSISFNSFFTIVFRCVWVGIGGYVVNEHPQKMKKSITKRSERTRTGGTDTDMKKKKWRKRKTCFLNKHQTKGNPKRKKPHTKNMGIWNGKIYASPMWFTAGFVSIFFYAFY